MNENREIYFITLLHCVGLLKEEMTQKFPTWTFHQGRHNFAVYGMDRTLELEDLHDLPITFQICSGLYLKTGPLEVIEEAAKKYQKEYNAQTIHRWDLIEEDGEMGDRKVRGPVLDIIKIDPMEYAIGIRYQVRGDFAPYKGSSPIPLSESAPALGFQRMGEVFKHFRPLVAHEDVFLDLGCAPGGATFYLLEKGFRVIGVDTKDVDEAIREKFSEGFLQLKQPVGELNWKFLKGLPPVNWIVVDLDRNYKEFLPKVLKLVSKLDECAGLIFHVKVEGHFDVVEMRDLEEEIAGAGLSRIRRGLLPSHGKEFCLIAQAED